MFIINFLKRYCKISIRTILLLLLLFPLHYGNAQKLNNNGMLNTAATFQPSRFRIAVIGETAITTLVTAGLQLLWYKKYPHSRFHFFNDNREWLGMDKLGHATTAYNISAIQYNLMRWSGVNNSAAILTGGLTGLGYLLMIEIMDGFSSEWGFSPGDLAADIFGSGFFMLQQYKWDEQKIEMRFSFHPSVYAKYNPNELGTSFLQRVLKDYNGQSYWLSFNIRALVPAAQQIPRWANVDIGYSAEGMTGATTNPTEINGKEIPSFERQRKLLFGLGAAWNKKDMTPFPGWVNIFRIPTPVLIWKTKPGKIKLNPFYF